MLPTSPLLPMSSSVARRSVTLVPTGSLSITLTAGTSCVHSGSWSLTSVTVRSKVLRAVLRCDSGALGLSEARTARV